MGDFTKSYMTKYGSSIIFLIVYFYWLYIDITNDGEITISEGFLSYTETFYFYFNIVGWSLVLISLLFYMKSQKNRNKEGKKK